jgi:hypothetical protein
MGITRGQKNLQKKHKQKSNLTCLFLSCFPSYVMSYASYASSISSTQHSMTLQLVVAMPFGHHQIVAMPP